MAKLSLAGVEALLLEGTLFGDWATLPGGGNADGVEVPDREGVGLRVG